MEPNSKKKLERLLEHLEVSQRDRWKEAIEKNRDEYNQIKDQIRLKQDELINLVQKKKAQTITTKEFNILTAEIQQELYELESKILKMRLFE
ncbi:MAG: hypothetical protein ACTSRS_01935 [Candidatus Helarchaeota archaeon]